MLSRLLGKLGVSPLDPSGEHLPGPGMELHLRTAPAAPLAGGTPLGQRSILGALDGIVPNPNPNPNPSRSASS